MRRSDGKVARGEEEEEDHISHIIAGRGGGDEDKRDCALRDESVYIDA